MQRALTEGFEGVVTLVGSGVFLTAFVFLVRSIRSRWGAVTVATILWWGLAYGVAYGLPPWMLVAPPVVFLVIVRPARRSWLAIAVVMCAAVVGEGLLALAGRPDGWSGVPPLLGSVLVTTVAGRSEAGRERWYRLAGLVLAMGALAVAIALDAHRQHLPYLVYQLPFAAFFVAGLPAPYFAQEIGSVVYEHRGQHRDGVVRSVADACLTRQAVEDDAHPGD